MKPKYLVDTHAFLWAAQEDARLGRRASHIIHNGRPEELGLCDVTIQEVGMLLHHDRISINGHPGRELCSWLELYTVLPTSVEAAILAPALPLPQGDPFDRIIVATAKTLGIPLLTRDAAIAASGLVKVVW